MASDDEKRCTHDTCIVKPAGLLAKVNGSGDGMKAFLSRRLRVVYTRQAESFCFGISMLGGLVR